MKIAIAGGHSKKASGAAGYLNEYECDRAFVAKLIPALKAAGHTVVDCSNEKPDQNSELAEEVRLANASGADLFVAVHFNAGGGTGTECYTYTGTSSKLAKDVCAKMSANVANALGIKNRGAKTASFYVLRNTKMPAVLLEVCFVDTKADADAWHRTSWEALCKAVVSAVGGSSVPTASNSKPAAPAPAAAAKPAAAASTSVPSGKYVCQVNGLRIREEPNGKIVPDVHYDKGGTVNLDGTSKVAGGIVWGRYIGASSGKYRWVGVWTTDGKKTYMKRA